MQPDNGLSKNIYFLIIKEYMGPYVDSIVMTHASKISCFAQTKVLQSGTFQNDVMLLVRANAKHISFEIRTKKTINNRLWINGGWEDHFNIVWQTFDDCIILLSDPNGITKAQSWLYGVFN